MDGDEIRPYRLAIGEEYGDADMSRIIAGIKNAGGLVRDQRRIRERALRGNVAFRYGPTRLSQRRHFRRPCLLPDRVNGADGAPGPQPELSSAIDVSSRRAGATARSNSAVCANFCGIEGCAPLPLRQVLPIQPASRMSRSRRHRTVRCWCVAWRWAFAG